MKIFEKGVSAREVQNGVAFFVKETVAKFTVFHRHSVAQSAKAYFSTIQHCGKVVQKVDDPEMGSFGARRAPGGAGLLRMKIKKNVPRGTFCIRRKSKSGEKWEKKIPDLTPGKWKTAEGTGPGRRACRRRTGEACRHRARFPSEDAGGGDRRSPCARRAGRRGWAR